MEEKMTGAKLKGSVQGVHCQSLFRGWKDGYEKRLGGWENVATSGGGVSKGTVSLGVGESGSSGTP